MRADQEEIARSRPPTGLGATAPKSAARLAVPAGRLIAIGLAVALGFAHLACGKSKKLGPGSTAPNPVTNFQAEVLGSDTVRLTWNAPSGDSPAGRATGYDIRQSATAITDSTFSSADTVGTPPAPGQPQASQQCYATEIPGSATRYFAIRASNQAGEWSPLEAVGPVHTAADTIPPGQVTDLAVVSTTDTTVTLSWTAPGDDGTRGQASRVQMRYLGGNLTDQVWPIAHVATSGFIPAVRAGVRQSATLTGVQKRVKVDIGIRVFDETTLSSPTSNPVVVTLRGGSREWTVRIDQSGDAPRIQAALDSALTGDVVSVDRGTYHEALVFAGRAVTLRSIHGPEETTIDASGLHDSVVTFLAGERNTTRLEGFTITGGEGGFNGSVSGYGGGILCRGTSPTITHNIVRDNRAARGGGGLYFGALADGDYGRLVLIGNHFLGNHTESLGGALLLSGVAATLDSNKFQDNTSAYDGGAVYLAAYAGNDTLTNSQFIDNYAGDHGGGAHVYTDMGRHVYIAGCVFARNVARGLGVGETGSGGALYLEQTAGIVEHNTLIYNTGLGESPCGGGGISVDRSLGVLQVAYNLIAFNEGCGMACREGAHPNLVDNILWGNFGGEVDTSRTACGSDWIRMSLIIDPLLCLSNDSDFSVREGSPALSRKEVIGAIREPGCVETRTGRGATW